MFFGLRFKIVEVDVAGVVGLDLRMDGVRRALASMASRRRVDGVERDAIAATVLSPTRRDGPKQLKTEQKTAHDLV